MTQALFDLKASVRTDLGKGASRRLRRQAQIPAVIYGGDDDAQSIMIEERFVNKAVEHEAFFSHILTVEVDGQKQKAVIKAIQRHPFKPKILHMDFLRISAKQKLTMSIPLHFIGEELAPGVKEGGIISHQMVNLDVNCLPADLPEYIDVDVSNLAMDESIHLSQVVLPQGVELATPIESDDQDLQLASIHAPRAARIEEEETSAAEEGAAEEGGAKSEEENKDNKK